MVGFFHKIVTFLNEEKIPYMLTGSVAMSLYTLSRSTKDFDFVVQLRLADVPKVVAHFKDGYYVNDESISEAIRYKSMFNIIEHATSFKVDFVVLKNEEFRQAEFARRQKVNMHGTDVYVVSLDDLIISKLIWIQELQSAVQMEDIKVLLAAGTNLEYIHYWIKKLNLHTFGLIHNND